MAIGKFVNSFYISIVPFPDTNRNEYLEALKKYREEKSLAELVLLFEKEQKFYLEECRYFIG